MSEEKRISTAIYKISDCVESQQNGSIDTVTGRIDVRGYASPTYPPYAKYFATELNATDGSENSFSFGEHQNGPQNIAPGRYRHTVRGQIVTYGDCQNKTFQVISEVRY